MTTQNTTTLNIALVGCGQIADAHLRELAKIENVKVIALCDSYLDLAQQAAARFDVENVFDDLDKMLSDLNIDVVHITTPAHTHGFLAKKVLEAGCHVYVEKPFTVDAAEAEEVITVARKQNRLVCVGHDQLFDPIWIEAKSRIQKGWIGDVQHVESTLVYPMTGSFGAQVTANPNHWVRKLPGGLFHNTISHPLYRITDLLTDETPKLDSHWYRRFPTIPFPTELRVQLMGENTTGSLTFLSSTKPSQRITRVYGDAGGLEVNFDAQTIRKTDAGSLPGAFEKLQQPYRQWREGAKNLRSNFWKFLKSDIHYFAGMKELFEQFYTAIRGEGPVPIPEEEIIRVTRMMDNIFEQCTNRETKNPEAFLNTKTETTKIPAVNRRKSHDKPFLKVNGELKIVVTGATGFLGRRLVRQLAQEGQKITCLVRPSSDIDPLRSFLGKKLWQQVSIETVELTDVEQCAEALKETDILYHVAAALGGPASTLFLHTVVPTRKIIEASLAADVGRFVLVSSIGIYGTEKLRSGKTLDETCPVDPAANLRDPYTFSKVGQEQVAWQAYQKQGLPLVVIRPGVIYGEERGILSNRVGLKFGGLLIRMGGRQQLPYTFVENCAEGIMRAGIIPDIEGEVFNLVDDNLPRRKDIVRQLKKSGQRVRQMIIPQFLIGTFARVYDWYSRWSEGQLPGVITPYKSAAMWKSLKYTNQKAKEMLFWIPRFQHKITQDGFTTTSEPAAHKINWTPQVDSTIPTVPETDTAKPTVKS